MNESITGNGKSLTSTVLRSDYNTNDDNIIQDFYGPCLINSINYNRAVGYFRANIYRELGEDLLNFAIKGGKVTIVCSPDIRIEDEEAAREGYERRGTIVEKEFQSNLVEVLQIMSNNPEESDCLNMLRFLIENNSMELLIATRPGGIYHRKIGVFYDRYDNFVSFSGSGNETLNAIGSIEDWSNDEEFDVYRSWGEEFESRKADKKRKYIEDLILGKSNFTKVRPLNEIEHEELNKYRNFNSFEECRPGAMRRNKSKMLGKLRYSRRKEISIRPYYYQQEAIEKWKKNNNVGLLSMATGTGKTITALFAIEEFIKKGKLIVILVPSEILLEQWQSEFRKIYPNTPLLLAGGKHHWKDNPKKRMFISNISQPRVIISTMATASSADFTLFLSQLQKQVLVVDEAHRIGSPTYRSIIEKIEFKEKLGLSATPERYFDPEGNEFIDRTFELVPVYNLPIDGKVKISKDSSKEIPILGKFLSNYYYYYFTTHLNSQEQDEWNEVTKEIQSIIRKNPGIFDDNNLSSNKYLQYLLIKRARILKQASSKISVAEDAIKKHYKENDRWIVYCDNEAQLREVKEVLTEAIKYVPITEYHSGMRKRERDATLEFFEKNPGIIVSIKCLDEGVDIPSVNGALILASSKNPREYIQRRGRVLRKSKDKQNSTIIDTIILPSEIVEDDINVDPIIKGELARSWKFAQNALNADISHSLWKLAMNFNIDVNTDSQIAVYEEEEVKKWSSQN